jgi:hypothetical protein
MYSLEDYIKQNSERIPWITDVDRQVIAVAGLDMVASVVESLEDRAYPLVLVEDVCTGFLLHNAEFLDNATKHLWIIGKSDTIELSKERKELMKRCFNCGIDVLRLLTADYGVFDIASGWDRERVKYVPLSNAGYCFGYMFTLYFYEDMEMSDGG